MTTVLVVGGEVDRWNAVNDGSSWTDVNFNLNEYIIQRKTDNRHRQRVGHHLRTSSSADATRRNWRRADVVDDSPARERNTWELTHRCRNSPPVGVFPARLIAGDGRNSEPLAAVDSSDEDVWIPRLYPDTSQLRVNDVACHRRDRCEPKSSPCTDVLRTRAKPAGQLCSTRS